MDEILNGKRVLVVTHGGTIFCFRYVLERWTYEEAERTLLSRAQDVVDRAAGDGACIEIQMQPLNANP